MLQIKHQLQTF